MKTTELRIGNYVYDIDNDILQIGEILDIGVKFKNTSLSSRYSKIKPIPLTEEILLKCGFTRYSTGSWCKNLKNDDSYLAIDIKYRNGTWLNINQEGQENTIKLSHIKNVHQLQNLYHALTGEELTVNL